MINILIAICCGLGAIAILLASIGILRMPELDKVLDDLVAVLDTGKPEADMEKVTTLVNGVIALISAINEEVKRGLRKTGS